MTNTNNKSGQTVAYIRVSTIQQNTARQRDMAADADKVFEEKTSGKNKDRPELQRMMDFVREGDTVRVHSMDRLGRSTKDLHSIVDELVNKGVTVEFVKENITLSNNSDTNAISNLIFGVFAAIAQFERENARERVLEGIVKAREEGSYKGRPKSISDEQIEEAARLIAEGVPKAEAARRVGVSRKSLYRYLDKAEEK